MTVRFCSALLLLCVSFQSQASQCALLSKYHTLPAHTESFCDETMGVLFTYNTYLKEPSGASYVVAKTPFHGYIANTGAYGYIKHLEQSEQMLIELFDEATMDKAYLIPPYNVVTRIDQVKNAYSMNNILAVSKNVWRGDLKKLLFEIDKIERTMFRDKGSVLAFYGVVSGKKKAVNELVTPQYMYRIYLQKQYQLSLSFLIPVNAGVDINPAKYISSIDCIEEVAGVDLFSLMDDVVENDFENRAATNVNVWARKDGNTQEDLCVI